MLVLSKGIHIVFPSERLPLRNMVVLRTRDSRSIFLVPRGGIVFVGTTDTLFSEAPTTWPRVTRADVEYLLQPLARSLHVEPPEAHDVVAAWAGLRPLVAQPGKRTTEVSRRDEILVGAAGVISVAGGKLTGYRPMARRVRARVQRELGRKLEASSEEAPLPGGDFEGGIEAYASRLASELGLAAPLALRLVRLYGSETPAVVKLGADAVAEGVSLIGGEVDWAVLCEGAACLEDVVYRRTRLALYEPTERQAAAVGVARRMAELLGWDAARRADELAALQERMRSELSFQSSEP